MKFLTKPFRYEYFHLTYLIIGLILGIFALSYFYPDGVMTLGFGVGSIIEEQKWWQTATYILLHFKPLSVFFGVLTLFFFGLNLERGWGSREAALFYGVVIFGTSGIMLGLGVLFGTNFSLTGSDALGLAVFTAWAAYNPRAVVSLFGIFPFEARWLAVWFLVIFDIILPIIEHFGLLMQFGPLLLFQILWPVIGVVLTGLYLALRFRKNMLRAFFG